MVNIPIELIVVAAITFFSVLGFLAKMLISNSKQIAVNEVSVKHEKDSKIENVPAKSCGECICYKRLEAISECNIRMKIDQREQFVKLEKIEEIIICSEKRYDELLKSIGNIEIHLAKLTQRVDDWDGRERRKP